MKNYIEKARDILSTKIDVEGDLLDLYTLLVFTEGNQCSLESIHNAWAIWRNKTQPFHRSLIPFSELTKEIQKLDQEYADAVRSTSFSI